MHSGFMLFAFVFSLAIYAGIAGAVGLVFYCLYGGSWKVFRKAFFISLGVLFFLAIAVAGIGL